MLRQRRAATFNALTSPLVRATVKSLPRTIAVRGSKRLIGGPASSPQLLGATPVNSYRSTKPPFTTAFAMTHKISDGIIIDGGKTARGSAVLIHPYVVLTAAHVVNNAYLNAGNITSATITFNREEIDPSTRQLSANRPWGYISRILEQGDVADYALLKIAWHGIFNPGVRSARINVSGVQMDQPIFGFHHPNGAPTHVSRGTVFMDRLSPNVTPPFEGYFSSQDIDISPGSSGGSVYNGSGRLVGIFHANFRTAKEATVEKFLPVWRNRGVDDATIMLSVRGIYERHSNSIFASIVDQIPRAEILYPDIPGGLFTRL